MHFDTFAGEDSQLNWVELMSLMDSLKNTTFRLVWPGDKLPLRFRAIPEVGGEPGNPITGRALC